MKRRLISLFLIAAMALSLFACGGKKDVLAKFEDELKSRNIAYEKIETAAAMIGAEKGVKFLIGDGRVEVYVFDKSSEAYKTAEKNQKISLAGFGEFPALITGGVAMMVEDLDTATYEAILRSVLD